jgi:hypothetical protein
MQSILIPNLIALILTLFIASLLDLKYRVVPLVTWVPALAVIAICDWFYYQSLPWDLALPQFGLTVFFSLVALAFVALRFYGGADAIAVILITLAFPVNPLTGNMQFIMLHVFVIACAMILVWSLLNFWKNVNAGHSGNNEQMIFGIPVPPDRLQSVKGWVYGMKRENGERVYTDGLTKLDLEVFNGQKEVWVVLAMPFVVPIFVAMLLAIFLA